MGTSTQRITSMAEIRIHGLQGLRDKEKQTAIDAAGATYLPEWSRNGTHRFALNTCVLDKTGQQVYVNLHSDGNLGSVYTVGEGEHAGSEMKRGKFKEDTRTWLQELLTNTPRE